MREKERENPLQEPNFLILRAVINDLYGII